MGIGGGARDFSALTDPEWYRELVATGFRLPQPVGIFPRLELPAEDAA
jgi:methionyl-tRNA synthetase